MTPLCTVRKKLCDGYFVVIQKFIFGTPGIKPAKLMISSRQFYTT